LEQLNQKQADLARFLEPSTFIRKRLQREAERAGPMHLH
jgi:hypothetical protein